MAADDDELPYWRRCELAWESALTAQGLLVTRLMDNVGNAAGTNAPMHNAAGGRLRTPDLMSQVAGVTTYWEVKFRSRPEINPLTGQAEYWMSHESAIDYQQVRHRGGSEVWIVLFDASASGAGSRWFKASISALFGAGRREVRTTGSGEVVDALVWPASCMEVIVGPPVSLDSANLPVLPEEGDRPTVPVDKLIPIERSLRRPTKAKVDRDPGVPRGVYDVLQHDAQAGLDVLRQQLGIPAYPRYSVLRIGLEGLDADEILGLCRYGIRVFLVSTSKPELEVGADVVTAFEEARLLEWSVIPEIDGAEGWWVDGRGLAGASPRVREVLVAADVKGGLNLGQYEIVHAEHSVDVLVTAGAGTGKTETMSERLVFLLATNVLRSDSDEVRHPTDLRLDEIALITFTREAAAEMRRRIARTLMLRQRLCDLCVLPATPWLMQLSSTDIDTIHSYAKKIIQRDGSLVGISPGFGVSPQTMQFRQHIQVALSRHLDGLYGANPDAPAEFEFVQFIEQLWNALSSNGLSPLQLVEGVSGHEADWGIPPSGLDGHISKLCHEVVKEVAERFGETCLESQQIPVSELVPTATAVLEASGGVLRRAPRYVFVDEFQDTDAEQMDMVIGLRRYVGSRLFVVGDEKQGIYRFRGAQGSAFRELTMRVKTAKMKPFAEFGLTKNFRSGRKLLDSLHPWFTKWGATDYLQYSTADRLSPGLSGSDVSVEAEIMSANDAAEQEKITVRQVKGWITKDPKSSVAVLCRRNSQAIRFQKALREVGIPCELMVGGNFFQTRAVVEVRVLLDAVLNPADDAALLELCETRWFSGISTVQAWGPLIGVSDELWGDPLPPMASWSDRLASFAASGNFDRADLEELRKRVRGLAYLLHLRPTLAWLVECSEMLQPKSCRLPGEVDDVDVHRYQRCLDHLLAKLDEAFADAPISPHVVLSWLRLQIATNESEDEPAPDVDSSARVTALTVHKAKGLEFDYVITPCMTTPFGAVKSLNEIAIVGQANGTARLLWKWKPRSLGQRNDPPRTNVAPADDALWAVEESESAREETRLLYVAMTRAKTHLVMLLPGKAPNDPPKKWSDLVKAGV